MEGWREKLDDLKNQAEGWLSKATDEAGNLTEDARQQLGDLQSKLETEIGELKARVDSATGDEKVEAEGKLHEAEDELNKVSSKLQS